MAFRTIDTEIWAHPDFQELPSDGKLLYIYCFTNSHCNAAGIYRITLSTISFETGMDVSRLAELISLLQVLDIEWLPEPRILWVRKFLKHQTRSPLFLKAVAKALEQVSNTGIVTQYLQFNHNLDIPYSNGIDTVSIGYSLDKDTDKDKTKTQTKTQDNIPYPAIQELYNTTCIALPKAERLNDQRRKTIKARWNDGASIETFRNIFKAAQESDFLSGRNGKWTSCGFDWILKEANWLKISEGQYANKETSQPYTGR